jgi:hypothetical protein
MQKASLRKELPSIHEPRMKVRDTEELYVNLYGWMDGIHYAEKGRE